MLQRKPIFPNVIELNVQAGHLIGCNVYLIHDSDEWALIDIGYEDSVEEVRGEEKNEERKVGMDKNL